MEKTIKALIIAKEENSIPRLGETNCIFSYAEVTDAAAARNLLEADGYALIVIDNEIAGLDGLSLVQNIRQRYLPGDDQGDDPFGCVYIIVLGCPDDESILNDYLGAGADDVLLRSADPWQIKKSLQTAHRILMLNYLVRQHFTRMTELQKAALIGRLVPGIAHEINNPLGFVDGNLAVLTDYCRQISEELRSVRMNKRRDERSKALSSGDFRETSAALDIILSDLSPLLDETREGLKRMKKLVRDIQQVSHSTDGPPTDIDINTCLDAVLNVLRNELKYKAVINKQFESTPSVLACSGQIHQAFLNLLFLVARAVGEKGEIKVATSNGNGHITVMIDAGDHFADGRTSLNDDEAAFVAINPRGEAASELLVAQAIIQRHNGSLEKKKGEGNGIVFRVRLPKP